MTTNLIFLDTETTGLDDRKHEVWEIAWAVNDGPIEERVLVHSLKAAGPTALAMNGYLKRGPDGVRSSGGPILDIEIRQILKGQTLVCSNPPFDRGMLKARWMEEPWHHRSVDISSFAMPVLGHSRPMGLATVGAELREMGYEIPFEDHSASGDVAALRACYITLEQMGLKMRDAYGRKVYS